MSAKLKQLQQWLADNKLDALYLPRTDSYGNENLQPQHEAIAWLTGFSGSAGTVVITQQAAALFVDGRYELQAEQQLESGFQAVALRVQTPAQWLQANLPAATVVACPKQLLSYKQLGQLADALADHGIKATTCEQHPIYLIWHQRPPAAMVDLRSFDQDYAGLSSADKLKQLQHWLTERDLDAVFISAPDSVSWLSNTRSAILPYSQIALLRALVDRTGKCSVFIDSQQRLSAELQQLWQQQGIECLPAAQLSTALADYADKAVAYDASNCQCAFALGANWRDLPDPCASRKARKNSAEIAGMQRAHAHESKVWQQLLAWLDQQDEIYEADIEQKLEQLRQQNPEYLGASFSAIIGSGANGAIVHYRHQGRGKHIEPDQPILIDTGAHYQSGSTDCTRTLSFGTCTAAVRQAYTQVLQAHIDLATLIFPATASVAQLDAVARASMWRHGRDYQHGTGHGVGCCLSVHEAPPALSARATNESLAAGMILSIEPGYYQADAYGIRLENLYLVAEHDSIANFLCFQALGRVSFDQRLIDFARLSPSAQRWLEAYQSSLA